MDAKWMEGAAVSWFTSAFTIFFCGTILKAPNHGLQWVLLPWIMWWSNNYYINHHFHLSTLWWSDNIIVGQIAYVVTQLSDSQSWDQIWALVVFVGSKLQIILQKQFRRSRIVTTRTNSICEMMKEIWISDNDFSSNNPADRLSCSMTIRGNLKVLENPNLFSLWNSQKTKCYS